jgi:hypothetical protein
LFFRLGFQKAFPQKAFLKTKSSSKKTSQKVLLKKLPKSSPPHPKKIGWGQAGIASSQAKGLAGARVPRVN